MMAREQLHGGFGGRDRNAKQVERSVPRLYVKRMLGIDNGFDEMYMASIVHVPKPFVRNNKKEA